MDTRQIRLALGKGMETRLAAMLVQVASQYESSYARLEGVDFIYNKCTMEIREDGVILAEEEVLTAEGESAFDQLMTAARKHRIQLDFDGTAAGTYVRGIAHIYEYDFGTLSGWMYRVNGVYADVGCSQYPLQEGDRVEWFYTRNIGRD